MMSSRFMDLLPADARLPSSVLERFKRAHCWQRVFSSHRGKPGNRASASRIAVEASFVPIWSTARYTGFCSNISFNGCMLVWRNASRHAPNRARRHRFGARSEGLRDTQSIHLMSFNTVYRSIYKRAKGRNFKLYSLRLPARLICTKHGPTLPSVGGSPVPIVCAIRSIHQGNRPQGTHSVSWHLTLRRLWHRFVSLQSCATCLLAAAETRRGDLAGVAKASNSLNCTANSPRFAGSFLFFLFTLVFMGTTNHPAHTRSSPALF